MDKLIIYPNEFGGIVVIHPCVQQTDWHKFALDNVPLNIPYRIIDIIELPTDRIFRNAWEADFSNPDGYGANTNI